MNDNVTTLPTLRLRAARDSVEPKPDLVIPVETLALTRDQARMIIVEHVDRNYLAQVWTPLPQLEEATFRLADHISWRFPSTAYPSRPIMVDAIANGLTAVESALKGGETNRTQVTSAYLNGILLIVADLLSKQVTGQNEHGVELTWQPDDVGLAQWAKSNGMSAVAVTPHYRAQPLRIRGVTIKLLAKIAAASDVGAAVRYG
jgi:hypothetical protein